MLKELDLPCDIEHVDIFSGAGRAPAYRKLHPHGFVPTLDDDGLVLIESSAILMYLADKYGDGKFAPEVGSRERAKFYEWMVYVPATSDPCLEAIMFNTMLLPEDRRDPKLVERSKKKWKETIEPHFKRAIERSFREGHGCLLGENFSAADIIVASSFAWAKMCGVLSADETIARYMESMMSRPAFIATHGA